MIRKNHTKLTAVVLVAALAAILITSATISMTYDTAAKRKKHRNGGGNSHAISQVNDCFSSKSQNAASQIQGDGNSVPISQSQD